MHEDGCEVCWLLLLFWVAALLAFGRMGGCDAFKVEQPPHVEPFDGRGASGSYRAD